MTDLRDQLPAFEAASVDVVWSHPQEPVGETYCHRTAACAHVWLPFSDGPR